MKKMRKFWTKLINKEQKQLNNVEKETLRVYKELLKEIKVLLSDADKKTPFGEDDAFNRMKQSQRFEHLMGQINIEIKKMRGKKDNIFKRGFRKLFELGYEHTLLSADYQLQPDISFTTLMLDKTLMEKSIMNPMSGLTFEELSERDEIFLKSEIKRALTQGLILQESHHKVAERIKERVNIDANRALKIARTEGTRVRNESHVEGMKTLSEKGVKVFKEWDARNDSRTRKDHQKLHGQKVGIDEKFKIGRYETDMPGHFGVAKQDINCRCVVVSVFDD